MSKRGNLGIAVSIVAILIAFTFMGGVARAAGPDDDWEMVQPDAPAAQPAQQSVNHAVPNNLSPKPPPAAAAPRPEFVVCGEPARAAQEPYISIVATLNRMWGAHASVYESVTRMSPHASPGGCIFYNRDFLQMLTSTWMGITDVDQLTPILFAINAHELGHIMHGDLTPARAEVPLETKELEADRFAGYTLWRLNVKRFDAAETESYYQAVGDDFVGAHSSHGTGKQRTTAFQQGWDLARTGAREDANQRPAGGLDSSEYAE